MKKITFRPNENNGPVIVLIGRRDTGKSFLVRDLLYYHQDIPIGTVISGTESGNGFYGKLVPKLFIHDEYNTAIIENILKHKNMVYHYYMHYLGKYNDSMVGKMENLPDSLIKILKTNNEDFDEKKIRENIYVHGANDRRTNTPVALVDSMTYDQCNIRAWFYISRYC